MKIHLTISDADFKELDAVAQEMKQPGNNTPKPQAVIRRIVAEYLETRKAQAI